MNHQKAKEELLKDPELRKAYNRPDPIYWIKRKWIDFRIWLHERGWF